MKETDLHDMFARHPLCKALSYAIEKNDCHQVIYAENLRGSAASVVLSSISNNDTPVVVVLNDEDEAGFFYQDMASIRGKENVLFFHSGYRRSVRFCRKDSAAEILRTEVVGRLASSSKGVMVVTYPKAVAVKVPLLEDVEEKSFVVRVNDNVGMTALEHRLSDMGFSRTDYVYEPGQVSVRGSILDVFSYSQEYPVRVDFFGDEIDSIRTFDVETQLSQARKKEVTISASMHAESSQNMQTFWDLLPEKAVVVFRNEAFCRAEVEKLYREGFSRQAEIERKALSETEDSDMEMPLEKAALLYDTADWAVKTSKFRKVYLSSWREGDSGDRVVFHTLPQPIFHKNMELMAENLDDYHKKGYTIYIQSEEAGQCDRIRDIMQGMGRDIPFNFAKGTLHEGFVDDDIKICFYTDHQVFERFHRYRLGDERAKGGGASLTLRSLRELEVGDYVVHMDHGIGRFDGLVRVEEGNTEQEMMKLTYGGGDVVYVSIHQLAKVSKYRTRDAEEPHLSRLGTGAWDRLKERTKKKIKDIARDLIKLYAERRKQKGYSFSRDSYLQHELEASFVYEDTLDQVRVMQEVKKDMESDKPMDRLVCGDVGFGKTEIAVRAAYKAAVDGKQVVVLVPTTVLAYQHYKTFRGRLDSFGVNIAYLSRAQTASKVKEVREGLASGKIDIVIGTQKLLAKNISFKDLGLLIIDEEQKFGVSTKERLRQMRVNIDTLAMSATPIPRTLQFSLMGARDLSVLRTPPSNRQPIHTEIHMFGHEVIADAIGFEMSRGGQVFVVCNRISSLPGIKDLIQKYVPDARVAIGHGQMAPKEMEKVIIDFMNQEYDVLLSTTIVENGIDIPNANTIIVVDAYRYGLSDLHQMRGRVGRGGRKAFCYLLSPPFAELNNEARRRLEAIEGFSDLGSGLQIAMRDLDIRGAGNLLGAEQSGFIADLGYETYQKVLSEAVTELKNEEFSEIYAEKLNQGNQLGGNDFVTECNVESDLPLYLSEQYVPGNSERMDCYRHLNMLVTDNQVEEYRKQLEDRFGKLPPEAENLLKIPGIRRMGCSLGVERILLKRHKMMLYFVSNRQSAYYQSKTFGRVLTFMTRNPMRGKMEEVNNHLRMVLNEVNSVDEARLILRDISTQQAEIHMG